MMCSSPGGVLGGGFISGLFALRSNGQLQLKSVIQLTGLTTDNSKKGELGFGLVKSPTVVPACPSCGIMISRFSNPPSSRLPFVETNTGIAMGKRVLAPSNGPTSSFAKAIRPLICSDGRAVDALGALSGKTIACASRGGVLFSKVSSMHGNHFRLAFPIPLSVGCSGRRKLLGLCTYSTSGQRTNNIFSHFLMKKATSSVPASNRKPSVVMCLGAPSFP